MSDLRTTNHFAPSQCPCCAGKLQGLCDICAKCTGFHYCRRNSKRPVWKAGTLRDNAACGADALAALARL
eukprot:gene10182-6825_t